jgi:hypothetical protein
LNASGGQSEAVQAAKELEAIGKRRGFTVNTNSGATPDEWSEDNAILFTNKAGRPSLLTSSMSGYDFAQAKDAVQSLFAKAPGQVSGLPSLGRAFVDGVSQETANSAKKAGWDVRTTPIAIDGGNMLAMADAKGGTTVLIGRNSLLVNWMAQRQAGQFDAAKVDQQVASGRYDKGLAKTLFDAASSSGKPVTQKEAVRMAAEIEITKGRIAQALNVPANKVVFIEQAGFHIDMETRPIGENKVMVSDLRASLKEIDAAIAELQARKAGNKSIKITPTPGKPGASQQGVDAEIKTLQQLRAQTQQTINNGAQAQLDAKAATLTAAGIQVVRAPINFGNIGSSAAQPIDVNFANGVANIDKQGRPYFITNQSASETLNKRFSAGMQKMGIAVEWVSTGTLLALQGGIDCITLQKGIKGK